MEGLQGQGVGHLQATARVFSQVVQPQALVLQLPSGKPGLAGEHSTQSPVQSRKQPIPGVAQPAEAEQASGEEDSCLADEVQKARHLMLQFMALQGGFVLWGEGLEDELLVRVQGMVVLPVHHGLRREGGTK